MATKSEVIAFLRDFHAKMQIWGVLFRDDRGKNTQALLDLDITRQQRLDTLRELKTDDYCEGPLQERLYGGADMWVFGKTVKKQEVYIKISMGMVGAQVICISFHTAEYAMKYPLKTGKS